MTVVLVLAGFIGVVALASYGAWAAQRRRREFARQAVLAKSLLRQFVASQSLRDWEDSCVNQAMDERKALSERVVSIGAPAVDPLIELLAHSDWAVRDDAVTMLGQLQSAGAIKPLLALQNGEESEAVQGSIRTALQRIRGASN